MTDNESRRHDASLGRVVQLKRHQDRVDRDTVPQVVALAEALALEAERVVERNRRLVPGKDVELELPDTGALRPRHRLVEQAPADSAPSVAGRHHQAEIGDMSARRVDVTRERESA